uniref:OCIA domain-containing protein n=1 Tax=Knipowitschia caucasica TaxID=637954 RepID=A0AAV2KXQ2_KNICA
MQASVRAIDFLVESRRTQPTYMCHWSSHSGGETVTVTTEGAPATGTPPAPDKTKGSFKCPLSDHHVHREDVRKVWKDCQEESFWYRALPISLGSMAVTGGLIYNGVWKPSPRFGPFPKLAVAGILGYAIGKVLGALELLGVLEAGLDHGALGLGTDPVNMCVKNVRTRMKQLQDRHKVRE